MVRNTSILFYLNMERMTHIMEEQKNLIWKDRKRVLGMPLTFTKYSLSEDRIFFADWIFKPGRRGDFALSRAGFERQALLGAADFWRRQRAGAFFG